MLLDWELKAGSSIRTSTRMHLSMVMVIAPAFVVAVVNSITLVATWSQQQTTAATFLVIARTSS